MHLVAVAQRAGLAQVGDVAAVQHVEAAVGEHDLAPGQSRDQGCKLGVGRKPGKVDVVDIGQIGLGLDPVMGHQPRQGGAVFAPVMGAQAVRLGGVHVQQALDMARSTLQNQQALYDIGALSQQDFKTAQDNVNKAQVTLSSAQSTLQSARTQASTGSNSDAQNLKNAQIAVEQARAALPRLGVAQIILDRHKIADQRGDHRRRVRLVPSQRDRGAAWGAARRHWRAGRA